MRRARICFDTVLIKNICYTLLDVSSVKEGNTQIRSKDLRLRIDIFEL